MKSSIPFSCFFIAVSLLISSFIPKKKKAKNNTKAICCMHDLHLLVLVFSLGLLIFIYFSSSIKDWFSSEELDISCPKSLLYEFCFSTFKYLLNIGLSPYFSSYNLIDPDISLGLLFCDFFCELFYY